MTVVLVVEDEPIVREVVVGYLRRDGYTTREAGDGLAAQQLIEQERPGLVVLDIMIPGLNGLDLCRWIQAGHPLPVILLSARGEETDRIVGLELGADDYVTKPFSPRELVCRVRSVLRRSNPPLEAPQRLVFGNLVIDAASRQAWRDGTLLSLTPREFDLLWFLAGHPRKVFSRENLMNRVWGYSSAVDTGTVTVHIRRLREKIEADAGRPVFLQTVWGVGYRFDR